MFYLVQLLLLTILSECCQARRYRTCEEGCCVHEYCAYHRICYPRIHCGLGCPDGQCTGQDHQVSEPVPQPEVFRRHHILSPSDKKLDQISSENQVLLERYSYQDKPHKNTHPSIAVKDNANNVNENVDNDAILSGKVDGQGSTKPNIEVPDGICMPYKPCKQGEFCQLGHSCTFNYNLGYPVCQYNLDIGSTLCYDNKGRPALQSLS